MREFNLTGHLFVHTLICAKVKYPIFGRNFLATKRVVENYQGRILTQIQTDLFIPAVDSKKQQKKSLFIWDKEQQEAFDKAKEVPLISVTLQQSSPSAQIRLNTDASVTHFGAMLMQRESQDQPWAPVAFYLKGLNSAQRKYSTYDRELLACYLTVKKFCHFLKGRHFQLQTDHRSLIPSLLREKTASSASSRIWQK